MRIAAEAWLLALRSFAENKTIISCLTAEHGLVRGLLYGRASKPQIGDSVKLQWHARVEEHLGQAKVEILRRPSGRFIDDPGRLAALSSASGLLEALLPTAAANPKAFTDYGVLLENLQDENWARDYVCWETELLASVGYGLDLSRCAITNKVDDLAFVSPKSGKAASRAAAAKYADKLLALPRFLQQYSRWGKTMDSADKKQIYDGLRLTGHFLALALHGKTVPGRSVLLELL